MNTNTDSDSVGKHTPDEELSVDISGLSDAELVEAVRSGVRVRWVPRHVSGLPRETYDEKGQERDLFIGTRLATVAESMAVAGLGQGRNAPLRCVESGGIGVYEIR